MKWALLQIDMVQGDCRANIASVERLMSRQPPCDVYVLPEMWATGFITSPTEATFQAGVVALDWMRNKAMQLHCYMAGTLAIAEDGEHYNRFFWISPEGVVRYYDKRHLFSIGAESRQYKAGQQRVIVDCNGMRVLLCTCYDLRFPVFLRNRGDYDVLLCVASWPAARASVWKILLQARAIENQCIAVGVNRVGKDEHGDYAGDTLAFDAYGRTITPAVNGEGMLIFEPNLDALNAFRQKFAVLSDADTFVADWQA